MDYDDLVHNFLFGDETAVQKGDAFLIALANQNKRIIAKTKVRLCKAKNAAAVTIYTSVNSSSSGAARTAEDGRPMCVSM
uniref:Uncharacterized protein n=1 Tax=Anguilla anguilla TaxID=7936 RepID=A0A0E9SPN5_ANGAN